MKPDCFDDEQQYEAWKELEKVVAQSTGHASYCADCTPAFAYRMRAVGRCGNPDMKFYNGVAQPDTGDSGYRGVSWHKGIGKWMAKKTFANQSIHLGYFDDPVSAHEAWVTATMRGPEYYGITNGTKSAKSADKIRIRGDNGKQHPPREDSVQEGLVRVRRHSMSE